MRVSVEADGGSRGNPGPAGYGAVVFGRGGTVLAERAEAIGVATNNVAEYRGLIAGLRAAADLGADAVEVRMDSKLVVEQMAGRWKVKHPAMRPLADEARALARGFRSVTFTWIPRADNAHADRLANQAMDGTPVSRTAAVPEDAAAPANAGDATGVAPAGAAGLFAAPVAPTAASARSADPGAGGGSAARVATGPARTSPAGWTGALGTPTKVLLLRHGQTAMSVDRRYSGRGDVALTALGEAQAAAAGRRVAALDGVDADTPILSSPLGRTRQTARAVAEATGGSVVVLDELVETDFGGWEGLTFTEAAERDPDLHRRWLSDTAVPPPGGESFDVVHERVTRARDRVLAGYAGRTVVVVSHVTPIKGLLRLALDVGPSILFRLHLDLASLSIAEFYPDGNASVRLVNDISHLA
ncbi:bifunctional RNase H/acid phosphatase [Actinokineospora sp. PR83]|uniref:bifunctional RNase H/acid phosphatase n=1 Tax=Actinokineospora sp. PR83 TaxID=2884908 RepID=UPI001F3F190A|nr:bifunctional RNase H/acid phosphatase [Actinokineospora sp. PR83]MCG8920619.1 bifunctional RNase H/acid phosphatase [Actinokineospora sp. PR83]